MSITFQHEPGDGKQGHEWDGRDGEFDFLSHLVLQVARMVEDGSVEDEEVREGCHG